MAEIYQAGEQRIIRKPVQEYLDNVAEVLTEPAKKRYKFVQQIYRILICLANYFFGPGINTPYKNSLLDVIILYQLSFGCKEPETLAKKMEYTPFPKARKCAG